MDIRLSILEEIEKSGNYIDYVTLVNKINAAPVTTNGVLQAMIEECLISGTLKANSIVKMEPSGSALLSQLRADADEKAYQHAENKRAKIHGRIFQVFLVLLSFFLGLIAEHFGSVIDFFTSVIK